MDETVNLTASGLRGFESLPTQKKANVAQLEEHTHGKGKVRGSIPRIGLLKFMAKKKRPFLKMRCKECKEINYFTKKSRGVEGKLELKKFCPRCKKHTVHKELKK